MKIDIRLIDNNPFRDFDLYPIDEDQVLRLAESIDHLGFFSGVTARRVGKRFQLAAGHHRVEAAKRAGKEEVEAVVDNYDDLQMVQIMTIENLTQRGYNAGAVIDSVAAYAKVVSRDILAGNEGARILAPSDQAVAHNQTTIAKDGPGYRLIMRAMNYDTAGDTVIGETEVRENLETLRESGRMAKIVAAAWKEAEKIRADREEEEERLAQEERDRLETEAERARYDAKRKKQAEKDEEKRRQQEEAIAAQADAESIYDARIVSLFAKTLHAATFRECVLGEGARAHITRDQQYPMAQEIIKDLGGADNVTAPGIRIWINTRLNKILMGEAKEDKAERERILRSNDIERVRQYWIDLRRGVGQAENALEKLVEEQAKWPYDKALFPMDLNAIETIVIIGDQIAKLKKKLGL